MRSGISAPLRRWYSSRGVNLKTLPEILSKFQFSRPTSVVSSLTGELNDCSMAGFINKKAKKLSKTLTFGSLRDVNGDVIQLVDYNSPSLIRNIMPESSVLVQGKISKKQDGSTSPGTSDLEFQVESVQVLNEASMIGSQLDASKTKEWPPEHRYLQLRQPEYQKMLRRRANIMKACRSSLDDLGFVEIETPMLFKSTPEGAREFLVPTRKKSLMYALPQSPQQYKQLLMASGVHKYYQIARCFRDEDLRQDRQPEFTQLDMEMSFADGSDVQNVVEAVTQDIWRSVPDKNLYTISNLATGTICPVNKGDSYFRLTYRDAIALFGIDKPDLRSSLTIQDLSGMARAQENEHFPVVDALVLKNALSLNRQCVEALSDPRNYTNRAPIVVAMDSTDNSINWAKILGQLTPIAVVEDAEKLKQTLNLEQGDVVAFSTRGSIPSWENPTPLGRFRQLAIDLFPSHYRRLRPNGEPLEKDDFIATWVTEFPLFTPIERSIPEGSKQDYPDFQFHAPVACTHHPFTMVDPRDYEHILGKEFLSVRGLHYDLVVNGVELGGGSTRIHDVPLQRFIFAEALGIKNPNSLFGHLLTALDSGCPPHAGLAIGFDRMVAMLSNTTSIRDVLPFPKSITGADPVIGSPSKVSNHQLKPYHVHIVNS